MTVVFADSFHFFALTNQKDPARQKAQEFVQTYRGRVVTTGWVLTEVGDGLAHPDNRPAFLKIVDVLRSEANVSIIPSDDALLHAGIQLYRNRADKAWSLTDCISFIGMEREGVTDALTGDHHFEQAGYIALLK